MIKVKLIHPAWLSAPNGANKVMNALLQSKDFFAKNNIEMSSLSLDTFSSRSFDEVSQRSKLVVFRARLKKWLQRMTKYSKLASDMMIYITVILPSKRIVRAYLNLAPSQNEVAFFHTIVPCYYFLRNRRNKQRAVVVCHTNGDNFKMVRIYYPKLGKSFAYKKLLRMERYVIEHSDRIIFVAASAKNNFIKLHPEVNPKKVFFIYNGIPNSPVVPPRVRDTEVLEFVCVASISSRKGQHYIIEALKMFNKEDLPKVHFTFVGDGVDKGILEKNAVENGLDKYVTFAGLTQDVDMYLTKSDVFILLSEDEGLPIAIIEAMRASLPIISTPVGGIPEMVKNKYNGLLICPNVNDIYQVLCNCSTYDWEKMGKNSRKMFEDKFTIEKMVDGYANMLKF